MCSIKILVEMRTQLPDVMRSAGLMTALPSGVSNTFATVESASIDPDAAFEHQHNIYRICDDDLTSTEPLYSLHNLFKLDHWALPFFQIYFIHRVFCMQNKNIVPCYTDVCSLF